MTNSPDILTAIIPEDHIVDAAQFEEDRQRAYAQDKLLLTSLAEHALAATADHDSVYDQALEQALGESTDAEDVAAGRTDRIASAASGVRVYEFLINNETGDVTDIFRREELGPDRREISRQQHMAAGVGFGPKQNRSGFRSSLATPRQHHS
jgi:hypothetical protein